MPTHNQKTVDIIVTERAKGQSDTAQISSIFGTSPIHSGELTVETVKQTYQDLISGGVNDGGHTFGTIGFNYATNGSPDYDSVETGDGGLPATARTPNPTSPGEGNGIDATKIPEAPDGFAATHPTQFGVGAGSDVEPKTTSAAHSSHTLKDYGLGTAVGSNS